ncbi:MAG: hypothetical protein E4H14_15405 [Candidatus Thorarchaeota archaeon]|nr:MAG: hypothetical protein E4H14_15405 [Candidatus Thorarchaeota archaeon]
MMEFLEFTVDQAIIIAVLLPIVAVCLFILVIPWLKNGTGSKFRRYLSYFVHPPQIDAHESEPSEDCTENETTSLWRETKVKLFFYYLAIALFLVSFMIGEFYEVIIDLSLPVTQGSTGELRTVSSIIFQSPFNAGWVGALPWAGFTTYYETWNWILFTAPLSDNPDFLPSLVSALLLFSFLVGLAFLSPLAIKSIRQSFLPSMFFFVTGMTIFTKAAISYLAELLALAFANAQIQYIHIIVTGSMISNIVELLVFGLSVTLGMFTLFIMLGRKLWKSHYSDSKSRNGFMAYITLSFVIGIALTIIMV